jgi:hypothetical protein
MAKTQGKLGRFNSLKHKEKTEDEKLEQQVLDLNGGVKGGARVVPVFTDKKQSTGPSTSLMTQGKNLQKNVSFNFIKPYYFH